MIKNKIIVMHKLLILKAFLSLNGLISVVLIHVFSFQIISCILHKIIDFSI